MKEKFYRFMAGRYGTDRLNSYLLGLSIFLIVISYFTNAYVIFLGYICWGITIFRMFSKNTYKRYQENIAFNSMMKPVDQRINLFKKKFSDKYNAYFLCPSCKQMVRVPKGRGKITITCPKCYNKFNKRT